MSIRTAVAAASVIIGCVPSALHAATGAASQMSNRPVRLIVPTAPSGSTDFIARTLAQSLGERLGQSVVVDNRAGAGGLIGLEIVARAMPDGHTLAVFNPGHMVAAQLSGKLSFKRGGDFTPIARSATTETLLVVHPGVPAKSVKELVELARAKPRYLNYASSGTAGLPHLGMELFRSMAGIELTHVPYKGIGPSIPDLVSGRVQLAITTILTAIPHVQAGRLRALASTGAKRLTTLPEVPTFAEAGYPRYDVTSWFGVFAPARMPVPVVARLNADCNSVVQQPEVVDRFAAAGIDPAGGLSSAQFADYVASALITWDGALKAAGMR